MQWKWEENDILYIFFLVYSSFKFREDTLEKPSKDKLYQIKVEELGGV